MNTYLFAWNPKRWPWVNLEDAIAQVNKTGKHTARWSCGTTKSIRPGDRAFLIKIGTEPKGIIAAGFVVSSLIEDEHWGGENKSTFYVDIDFDVLLNPDKEPILTLDILKTGNLEAQNWTPQASGISIRPELVSELEAIWFDFLTTQAVRHPLSASAEDEAQELFTEGAPNQVLATRYERNPFARTKCLEHYGYSCSVCNFNFRDTYGEIGKDFIHFHHLNQIANIGKEYQLDPIKDLRPVCPNCHCIIHKQTPPFTIEEVKNFLL